MGRDNPIIPKAPVSAARRADVKSSFRVLDIIEYFSLNPAPARTSEISAALGVPNSSVDEILRTLARRGVICFHHRSKQYAPSYKLVTIANQIDERHFENRKVDRLLGTLRQETGATVFLSIANDCWVEKVAEATGSWAGHSRPEDYHNEILRCSDDGWYPATSIASALLSTYTHEEIVKLADRSRSYGIGLDASTSIDPVTKYVEQVREAGVAVRHRNTGTGVDSVACPIRFSDAATPMVVGIVGESLFETAQEEERIVSVVRDIVREAA